MNMATVVLVNSPFYRILQSSNNQVRLQQAVLSPILERAGHTVFQYNADADRPENLRDWRAIYGTPTEQYKAVVKDPAHPIWREVREVLEKYRPDWVGVTLFSGCIEQAARIAEIAKELGAKTVAGGAHPTTVGNLKLGGLVRLGGRTDLTPADLHMKGPWDAVCIGDGEDVVVDIVEGRLSGVIMAGNTKRLDDYPSPQRDNYVGPSWFRQSMLNKGSMLTSRGCTARCRFCAQHLVAGESMRWLSPEYVMGQIREIVYGYGETKLTMHDDVFTLAEKRVRKLCELIVREDVGLDFRIETRADCLSDETLDLLKRAGCTRIKLGIESAVQRLLDLMNKEIRMETVEDAVRRIQRVGIPITANVIVGYPTETNAEARQTLDWCRKMKFDNVSVSIYTAYEGTPDHSSYGGIGLDDPSEAFHTNVNLLALSTVEPETVDELLALNEGRMTR